MESPPGAESGILREGFQIERDIMSKLSRRQLQRVKHFFREKGERAKAEAAKFDHRAAPGPGSGRESVVRIMAENVDQMAIVVSFVSPPLKTGLIDRFLVIAGVERVTRSSYSTRRTFLRTATPERR